MLPYVVVACGNVHDMYTYHTGYRDTAGNRGVGYTCFQEKVNIDDIHGADRILWFFQTEQDAAHWANLMAGKRSNVQYIVAKSMYLFHSVPSPAKKSVFSEKGVLPA